MTISKIGKPIYIITQNEMNQKLIVNGCIDCPFLNDETELYLCLKFEKRIPEDEYKGVYKMPDDCPLKVTEFKIGEPIPKTYLHMEFDFVDSLKYLGDKPIPDEIELKRLNEKYLGVTNITIKKTEENINERVKGIPPDGEFWQKESEKVFVESISILVQLGMSEDDIFVFLNDLYYATADCYGD
jgi:hypothetical protein